jgi:hypothetical protein
MRLELRSVIVGNVLLVDLDTFVVCFCGEGEVFVSEVISGL